jgi:hypothetical protein
MDNMDNERVLHETNEAFRMVGMYLFLFYLVACALVVFAAGKANVAHCFVIILCAVGLVSFVGFIVYAAIVIHIINKVATKKYVREVRD